MNDRSSSTDRAPRRPEDPLGDRGQGDKSWTPEAGEQGISNRADDEDTPDVEDESEDEDFDDDDSRA